MTRLQQQSGLVIALGLTTAVSSFSLQGASGPRMYHTQIGMSSPDGNGEDEEPHLVLGDMESEMQDVRANSGMEFDFGAIDYLAAAKDRAAAQVQSNNDVAGVEEWTALAEEKKEQFGEIDDWENSQKEAGNADSHILMFTEPPSEEGEGDGEDDEPKLLLF